MPWITFHGTFQRFIAQDGKYVFRKPIIQFVIVLDEVAKQQHPFICKNTVHVFLISLGPRSSILQTDLIQSYSVAE